jgi:succinate dehydrogenase / fumarate reductase cytochrome b subunit
MATTTTPAEPPPLPRIAPLRWLTEVFSSTVGLKFLVAVTGLALTGFVIFHLLGNLGVFAGRDAFNKYAQTIKSLGPLLWLARGGLLTVFLVHIFIALKLKKRNLDARPVAYKYERTVKASWTSRYMVLTGLVILGFVAFHLAHYTFGVIGRVEDPDTGKTTNYLELKDEAYHKKTGEERHDTYRMFIDGFRSPVIVGIYVVCMVLLGLHLLHGVRSIFQTLGLNHKKYNRLFELTGYGVTALVVAANTAMPVAVLFRAVGTDIP